MFIQSKYQDSCFMLLKAGEEGHWAEQKYRDFGVSVIVHPIIHCTSCFYGLALCQLLLREGLTTDPMHT